MTAREGNTIRDAEDQPQAPIPPPGGTVHSSAHVGGHNGDQSSLIPEEFNGKRKRRLASDKELKEEAGFK